MFSTQVLLFVCFVLFEFYCVVCVSAFWYSWVSATFDLSVKFLQTHRHILQKSPRVFRQWLLTDFFFLKDSSMVIDLAVSNTTNICLTVGWDIFLTVSSLFRDPSAPLCARLQDSLCQEHRRRRGLLHGQGRAAGAQGRGVFRRVRLGEHLHPLAGGDDWDGHLRGADGVGGWRRSAQRPTARVHPGTTTQVLHLHSVVGGCKKKKRRDHCTQTGCFSLKKTLFLSTFIQRYNTG